MSDVKLYKKASKNKESCVPAMSKSYKYVIISLEFKKFLK